MSDDEQVTACEDEAAKGHFDSSCRLELYPTMVDYPGYFELPYPFLDRHTRVWWEIAINPLDKRSDNDWAFYSGEWLAAVKLIKDYGDWAIDSVPIGILDTDEVPAIVKSWVMWEASKYISGFLPPRLRLKISAIM